MTSGGDLAAALPQQAACGPVGASLPAAPAPDDLRERLASLGYVGSQPASEVAGRRALPDPKDCIALRELPTGQPFPGCGAIRAHRDSIETPHFP